LLYRARPSDLQDIGHCFRGDAFVASGLFPGLRRLCFAMPAPKAREGKAQAGGLGARDCISFAQPCKGERNPARATAFLFRPFRAVQYGRAHRPGRRCACPGLCPFGPSGLASLAAVTPFGIFRRSLALVWHPSSADPWVAPALPDAPLAHSPGQLGCAGPPACDTLRS